MIPTPRLPPTPLRFLPSLPPPPRPPTPLSQAQASKNRQKYICHLRARFNRLHSCRFRNRPVTRTPLPPTLIILLPVANFVCSHANQARIQHIGYAGLQSNNPFPHDPPQCPSEIPVVQRTGTSIYTGQYGLTVRHYLAESAPRRSWHLLKEMMIRIVR